MASTVTIPSGECKDVSTWRDAILAAWNDGVKGIFATGDILLAAKAALPHGEFLPMIEQMPFGKRKAQMLMQIASDKRIRNTQNFALLPPSISALYDIAQLDDDLQIKAFEDGLISPDMERGKISAINKKQKRAVKEHKLATKIKALPDIRFGVIVADPEWRFEPWSRSTGMDRAADNHYPTSCLEVIKARDVPAIAADDCVLFLWATAPMLPHALLVMAAWGFDYKSHCIWEKDKIGTGYWFRNQHELLLVGTKGNPVAPAMGEQWNSVIDAERGAHSAKPEIFLKLVEHYFPTIPKIELNRRGPSRLGWAAWGLETENAA